MAKKLDKKAFAEQLAQMGEAMRDAIEASVDGFELDPVAQIARKKACRYDFQRFCTTYFPHYLEFEPSKLHTWLFAKLPEIIQNPRPVNLALAAPRGEAKSTIVSFAFIIWCIVYEHKHNIIQIMDSFEQSAENLEGIKSELTANPRLLMDFPDATGQGRQWQVSKIITANNKKVEAFGSGKKIRGKRHGKYRPDLVVGDDLENDENVQKPEQRDKLEKWLQKAVKKLGGAGKKIDIVIVGTVLHYDSLLNRILNHPRWMSRRFKSIIKWPDDMTLWEQFENILLTAHGSTDSNDVEQAEQAALKFYQDNKAAMDAGAEVSWPSARPLVELMIIRAEGHSAFDSEHQNDPVSGDDAPFANCITFWINRLADWRMYGTCDPSMGKKGNSRDPSALLVGGYNMNTGVLDVVEALIKKRVPDKIISDTILLQKEYKCVLWGFEIVAFQEFLMMELIKRSAAQHIHVPARGILSSTDKILRIEGLQPHVANGLIRLGHEQSTLISQLKHFPKADHDDGPDALEMLWQIASSGAGGIPKINKVRAGTKGVNWNQYINE